MTTAWYQVSCEIPATFSETFADFLTILTGCGVCTENRAVDSFSPDEIPELTTTTITCYLPDSCDLDQHLTRIHSFLAEHTPRPLPELFVSRLGEEDWADSWKHHFKPLQIGTRLLITPSWEPVSPDESRSVITLDPGMAFGTGGHETTRLCLECLEQILAYPDDNRQGDRTLDLGTGSGILAIAAAKLGIQQIDAVDIDPQAVLVAEENCQLNQVSTQVQCSTTPLEQLSGSYTIILANILAETLVSMAPQIIQRLSPGGHLILSGILAEREELVQDGFRPFPITLEASLQAGEWRCQHYRRME